MNMTITIHNATAIEVADVLRELASLVLSEPDLSDDLEWHNAQGEVIVSAELT